MITDGDACRLMPGEVRVWCADLKAETGCLPVECLSAEERGRAGRYRFDEDRRRFVTARSLLRSVISSLTGREPRSIVFEQGPAGKPRLRDEPLEGLRFNLSHSGDLVVLAIARGREVGVDVEHVRFPLQELAPARRYLAPGELAGIDVLEGLSQARAFFRTWTRKEALLKATGEGVSGMGPELDLSAGSDFCRRGKSWHVTDVDLRDGYAVALAIEGGACAVKVCPRHP